MYSVYVLDKLALNEFQAEYPWVNFPEQVEQVSVYLDDLGHPVRIAAFSIGADGQLVEDDIDFLGVRAALALIRFAPRGSHEIADCPDEAVVRDLLEHLPLFQGTRPIKEVEAERRSMLEKAYQLLRQVATDKLHQAQQKSSGIRERERIDRVLESIPNSLAELTDAHKNLFLELDLWRLIAIIRDEYMLPADYDPAQVDGHIVSSRPSDVPLEVATQADPIIEAIFDLSPVAFSISTIGERHSRYVRVNQQYLDLIGKGWNEIAGSEMVSSGVVVGQDDGRAKRLALLDSDGGYSGLRATIRNSKGDMVPVIISARRLFLGGQFYDFEVLVPEKDV